METKSFARRGAACLLGNSLKPRANAPHYPGATEICVCCRRELH